LSNKNKKQKKEYIKKLQAALMQIMQAGIVCSETANILNKGEHPV